MKIQKLPPEVRTKLQSGVIVTDTIQCVLELVRNSLDANASGIAVLVDLKKFIIKVIDNGKGIGKDDLELVGERFMTSKYQYFNNFDSSFAMYGYKGQALSSMLDFCRSMTIKTKSENNGPTLVKVFVKGKPAKITELDDSTCGTGTTVIIEDFMYPMPVRRKRIKEVFEMEEIKTQLQYLAIIHYNVCFTLRNENKCVILLQTSQALNMLGMISNLYGKTVTDCLTPVKYKENGYKVNGYVNMKLSKQNSIQIVYLNSHVISKGVIHKFINSVLKEYDGSKTLLTNSPSEQILKKLKNSHHTFIIKLQCPHAYYELFTNLRKTTVEFKNWKDVLKCIYKGLKKAYKFDCTNLNDAVNYPEEKPKKFGTSVLVNAVQGVPAMRNLKKRRGLKSQTRENCKKASFYENNENSKVSLIDSKEKERDEGIIDTLESPIPKNRINVRPAPSSSNSHHDMSYIEFYKWLKESFKTDAKAFNLYSEFLQHKSKKTKVNAESVRSPVLDVKLKEKRIKMTKPKVPEKKQKLVEKYSGILNQEIDLMTQNSLKIFPNVDLRMQKAVQFNTEMQYNLPEFSKFDLKNWRTEDEIFAKPLTANLREVISSPASSEIHFSNIIKFRNFTESFHLKTASPEEELYTNTWMSHYWGVKNVHNVLDISNTKQTFLENQNEENVKIRDVAIQTSPPNAPEMLNVMIQTSQINLDTNCNLSQIDHSFNQVPVPEFWNASTPENHPGSDAFFNLSKIIFSKPEEPKRSESSEFLCAQKPKSHSNPKSNTESQTLRHLWTDSLSEFGHPAIQAVDSSTKPDSIPKTIPLEEISSPHFCLTERHDFVPKGLSPRFFKSESVEIPALDSREKNRMQLTISDVGNDLLTVKWQNQSTGDCMKPPISDEIVSEMQFNAEKKSNNFECKILSASLSYCAIKVHSLLHSFTFTKELLSSVEVLGQLDEKFIVTTMKIICPKNMELLSLLDQHAVDERIKLEQIINEYIISDKFVSTALTHPLDLKFSESEVQVIIDLKEKMSNFGFDIKPKRQDAVSVDAIPSFLLDKSKKNINQERSLEDILRLVIIDIVREITETRGAVSKIPKIIHDAFCSEACHSAIKFNRALGIDAMTKMIDDLKNCKLPFQCAHGRPSVIPIIDLEDFNYDEDYNVDLQKLKKFYKERKERVGSLEV